uniref:Uncharacterized protein n=1 Tax=Vitis vinifera TaxID=29760 RepID=A5APT4_VITVI|nr:hypothetical protein VITISV_034581 [Vitis vinifera]
MAWMQSHGNFSHPEVISYELLEGEVFNSKFCINPLEPISMAIERRRHQLSPYRRRLLKPLYPARPLQELDGRGIVDDARGELSSRRPGSTEEAPHAPVKAVVAGSVLGRRRQAATAGSIPGRRRQAAATGSTPGRRRWNTAANTAQVALVEAARKVDSLDQLQGPSTTPLSPPLPPL